MESAYRTIIACRMIELEIELNIVGSRRGVQIHYIDQQLHVTPKRIKGCIQDQIDRLSNRCMEIVLGYGLCANGIIGVFARNVGLYVPKVHDCISLLLGPPDDQISKKRTRAYYLTPSWIINRKDPLSFMTEQYIPRMGLKTAVWGMKEELKHYTHFILIDTGTRNMSKIREKAFENARFFGKELEEISADPSLIKNLISGPLQNDNFIYIKPGDSVCQSHFFHSIQSN